jgi:hypothetical protein
VVFPISCCVLLSVGDYDWHAGCSARFPSLWLLCPFQLTARTYPTVYFLVLYNTILNSVAKETNIETVCWNPLVILILVLCCNCIQDEIMLQILWNWYCYRWCLTLIMIFFSFFLQGDCWICMELMDTSLDKFYKFIYEKLQQRIPESILGKITVAVSKWNILNSASTVLKLYV